MKTEPDTFSWDDLVRAKDRTTSWEGVRNYQARNMMRDEMKLGDQALIYHSSCETPGIVGLAEVVREAHPDLSALDPKSEYFDEKAAKDGESRWAMVAVKAVARFEEPLTLARIRETKALGTMLVLKRGQRLSIQPVTEAEAKVILKMGRPKGLEK